MNAASWQPANFEPYEPSLLAAVIKARQFLADIGTAQVAARWLAFSGVTGCGKTTLAAQLFDASRRKNPADLRSLWQSGSGYYRPTDRRPGCAWMTATEFADRSRRDFDYPTDLGRDFLVAVDDIGAARDQTAFVAEALYRLCNARMGKWTIFTTNFSLTEIGKNVDERVASRMVRDGNVFHRIAAGDYALKSK